MLELFWQRYCRYDRFRLSIVVMETEVTRRVRERQKEVLAHLDKLRPRVAALEAELEQIEQMLAASEGPIPIKGDEGSMNARAHFARLRHPEIANFTLKEIVVKALGEHFPHGATANQLLDFFDSQWGRKEMRTSLSPQLSRLKESGMIILRGKVWHLAREEVDLSEVFDTSDHEEASS